ncbi:MFS transporter [Sporosarcina sp. ANT_H38]|uniref:MFS transporter n=1 Tax=Sporosarcina sp. ANT_H38 TaxID=2597358 RepID=UPI0011F23F78|nr:MFS transporter [Sporosarcina sp. ANT_H38]KAA0948811.1 MFS transporter [Sporosarcina sp. ANT_H38]
MSQSKKKIHYAWWVLLGLVVMVGAAKGGIMTTGGLFLTPVTEDLGIGMGSLTLYFSISSIVTMISLPIAGKMMAKYNIRILLVAAVILEAGSFAMFGLMNSVWGWYLFAIPMAMGSVFVTQLAGPVLINNWFKKHKGLAIGIMVGAGGLIGAFLQPVAGNLIASEGWRTTYIILGIGVMAVVIPVVLLTIRMAPKHKGLQPYGMDVVKPNDEIKVQTTTNSGVTAAIAKKSSAFYFLLLFFFFDTSIAAFNQHVAPFAMGLGYDIQFAGNAMGAWSVGVVIGALFFGFLSDKIGVKNTAIFAMLLGLVPVGILIIVPENPMMFTIATGLYGFVVASLGTLGPLLTTALFGNKEFSQIYGLAITGLAVAGIVALPGYGFIFELTGSYTYVLYGIFIMLLLNVGAIILAFKGKKKFKKAGLWNL